jgi:hypothetical protein
MGAPADARCGVYSTAFYVHDTQNHVLEAIVTYNDFVAELDKAALTIRAFAGTVGMQPNSISNYASHGEVPTHLGLIAALLAELRQHGISSDAAIERVGPLAKRARGRAKPGRFGGDPQEQLDLGR